MVIVMWKHRTSSCEIYYCNSIVITNFVQSIIPNCLVVNVLPAYFGIEIAYQNFHMIFREFFEHTSQLLEEAVLYIINFILCYDMNAQNNDMSPVTS
jgi:hypothetical protein